MPGVCHSVALLANTHVCPLKRHWHRQHSAASSSCTALAATLFVPPGLQSLLSSTHVVGACADAIHRGSKGLMLRVLHCVAQLHIALVAAWRCCCGGCQPGGKVLQGGIVDVTHLAAAAAAGMAAVAAVATAALAVAATTAENSRSGDCVAAVVSA